MPVTLKSAALTPKSFTAPQLTPLTCAEPALAKVTVLPKRRLLSVTEAVVPESTRLPTLTFNRLAATSAPPSKLTEPDAASMLMSRLAVKEALVKATACDLPWVLLIWISRCAETVERISTLPALVS